MLLLSAVELDVRLVQDWYVAHLDEWIVYHQVCVQRRRLVVLTLVNLCMLSLIYFRRRFIVLARSAAGYTPCAHVGHRYQRTLFVHLVDGG